MAPLIFPHGWCGDAWPGGLYVVQVPFQRPLTHHGPVELPPGESRGFQMLVLSRSGEKFAGLLHDLGHVWEWDGSWHDRGYRSGRVGYVGETLVDIDPPGVGFVTDDGQIVPYVISYSPKNELSQWCETLGLQFGQSRSAREGVRVWDGRDRRVVEYGPCNEIHAHGIDGIIACSYRKDNDGFYILEAPAAAFLAGPKDEDVPPPPPPPPPPEKPMSVPNESAFVASFLGPRLTRLASEDATRAHSFEAVNACCVALRSRGDMNWGLLEKTSGATVRDRAADILCYALGPDTAQVVDVVNDAEGHDGNPSPGWSVKDIRPIAQWKQPYPAEEPPPPPPPPDNTIEQLQRELAAVRAELQALRSDVNAARGQAIAASGSVATLRADFDNYTAHPPLPTDVVKRGDPVQVRGSIGLAAALSGSKVTWNGVIGELPKGTVSVSKSGRG